MMEATQDWEGDNVASCARSLTHAVIWRGKSLTDALVRSRASEVHHILFENPVEVPFAHDEDVVEAFAPDTTEDSFTDRILLARQHLVRRMEHKSSK